MTPLEVLGLPATATPAEIRSAYKALAQIYHPDRYATAPEAVRNEAAARMLALNLAYEQLTNGTDRRDATQPSSAEGPPFAFASPQWFDAVEQICAAAPPCTPSGERRFMNAVIDPAIPGVIATFHWGFDENGRFCVGRGHKEDPWLTQRDSYAATSRFLEINGEASTLTEAMNDIIEDTRGSAAALWRSATGKRRSRGNWWRWNQAWGRADSEAMAALRTAIAEITSAT